MSDAQPLGAPAFTCDRPAPIWETLELLASKKPVPRRFLYVIQKQHAISDSLAFREDGQLRAVLHFVADPDGKREVELCAFFGATPPRNMLRIVRQTQLTLHQLAENDIAAIMWVTRLDQGEGHRLARVTGFSMESDGHPHGTLYRWRPSQ